MFSPQKIYSAVLFREVFSHPYISLFHLLVNGFSVIYVYTLVAIRRLTSMTVIVILN